jgi:hypothetical protein
MGPSFVDITMNQELERHLSTRSGCLDFVEQLRGGGKRRWPIPHLEFVVRAFVYRHGVGVYRPYEIPDLTLHRARKLEGKEPFKHVSDLGSPPAEYATGYGRCHIPQKPVCYCSLYEDTALAEIYAEPGQRYVIATYKFSQSLVVLPIGEFDYFRRTGASYLGSAEPSTLNHYQKIINGDDGEVVLLRQLVDAYFAEEFISPVSSNSDYKLTAVLSSILFDLPVGDPFNAIFYPSVAFRGGVTSRSDTILKNRQ